MAAPVVRPSAERVALTYERWNEREELNGTYPESQRLDLCRQMTSLLIFYSRRSTERMDARMLLEDPRTMYSPNPLYSLVVAGVK